MGEVIAKSINSPQESAPNSDASNAWDGVVYKRPYDFETLLEAAQLNSYHQRCIFIKAMMSVGLGYDIYSGDAVDENAKKEWEALWPNGFQAEQLKLALDLEAFGNAYIEAVPANRSDASNTSYAVKALYHVPAVTMYVKKDGFRQQVKSDTGYKDFAGFNPSPQPSPARGEGVNSDHAIIHLKLYSPQASIYGVPDWIGCLNSIILDANATEFNYQFFKNNCVPAWAIVVTDGTLGDEGEAAIKDFFSQKHKGVANAHKTLLLTANGAKIDFKELQSQSKEMSFEKLKGICRDEVITAHGVPPRMVGVVSAGALGGGGEMQWQLRSFKEGICKARQGFYSTEYSKLMPEGMAIRYHEMDVTDSRDDAEFYQLLVTAGIYTPNEARAELGKPELKELDQMALMRLLSPPQSGGA